MPEENFNLAQAAALFLASLSPQEREGSQKEVNRFVRWYGGGLPLRELTPPLIASYAEGIGGGGIDPMKRLEPVRAFLAYARKQGLTQTNLASHLRVVRPAPKKKPTLSKKAPPRPLTAQGYSELKAELASLKDQRPRIAEELRQAMADKDFRENAPLEATREYQAQIEARIRELEARLEGATLLPQGASQAKVDLGHTVTLRDLLTQEEVEYTLVHPAEANPAKGKLSFASPVGKALLERREGEVVEVAAPGGTLRYLIQRIQR